MVPASIILALSYHPSVRIQVQSSRVSVMMAAANPAHSERQVFFTHRGNNLLMIRRVIKFLFFLLFNCESKICTRQTAGQRRYQAGIIRIVLYAGFMSFCAHRNFLQVIQTLSRSHGKLANCGERKHFQTGAVPHSVLGEQHGTIRSVSPGRQPQAQSD